MSVDAILDIILSLIAVFMAIVFHEVAHGYIAARLGDPTAKNAGRLSLNPLSHVDPVGTVFLPLMLGILQLVVPTARPIMFGWAKPVPVNPSYFKNPLRGMLFVALAGPGTNLVLAGVATLLGRIVFLAFPDLGVSLAVGDGFAVNALRAVFYILGMFVIYCVILAAFNMLPVPPLDGSRVLTYFLPASGRQFMLSLERYGFLVLILVILVGGLDFLFSGIAPFYQWLLGRDWLIAMFY